MDLSALFGGGGADGSFFDSILGSILILLNPILAVIEAFLNLFTEVGNL